MAKKPFFRRTWVIVVLSVLGFIAVLLGAIGATVALKKQQAQAAPTPIPTAVPTAVPTATPQPNYYALSFDPELDKLPGIGSYKEDYAEILGGDYWVDITPANKKLPEAYVVFRHVTLGLSYILFPDGTYVRLGETTAGCGVVNAVYEDLNLDGVPELLYTYTAEGGSGICCKVGWMDLDTRAVKEGSFSLQSGSMALQAEGGGVLLYRASLSATESSGFYVIDYGEKLGELLEQEGELYLSLE